MDIRGLWTPGFYSHWERYIFIVSSFWRGLSKNSFKSKYLGTLAEINIAGQFIIPVLEYIIFIYEIPFPPSPKNNYFGLNYPSIDSKTCLLCSIQLAFHPSMTNWRQIPSRCGLSQVHCCIALLQDMDVEEMPEDELSKGPSLTFAQHLIHSS